MLLILAILYLFDTVAGINCYFCTSGTCEAPITLDCSTVAIPGFTMACLKVVGKDKKGNEGMVKGCAPKFDNKINCDNVKDYMKHAADIEKPTCYQCSKDKCNSVPDLSAKVWLVAASVVLYLKLMLPSSVK